MKIDIDSIFSFHQIGLRDNQEDSRYPDTDRPDNSTAAFAVCDGVGGCDKGEVASSTVCAKIGELMASHKNTDYFSDREFTYLLQQTYNALDKVSNAGNKGMGTTLTFLAFHSGGALAAHIGDSRIYQIRPNEGIIYRSEDHSLVNALLRSGNISPEEVKTHPRRNVITRCMNANDGVRDRDEATVINLTDIAPGDYFILCSDGVSGEMDDEDLISLYSSSLSDEEKYSKLAALSRDSSDNNTAIQIHIASVSGKPEEEPDLGMEAPMDGERKIETRKLNRKDESVHDVGADVETTGSRFKAFLNRLFG